MLKSLLWRKRKRDAENLALQKVYLSLYQAQQQHSLIELQLDGDSQSYESMLLSLDQHQRTILIDELLPQKRLDVGQCVTVTVRQTQGRQLQFNSVIVDTHTNDRQFCVLAMPQSLEEEQRRSSYRLPVNNEAVASEFVGPDESAYRAQLHNLSASGICLELNTDESLHWQDATLKHLSFQFQGNDYACDVNVRNVRGWQDGSARQYIGGEFVDMPADSQQELEKSIRGIQQGRARLDHPQV